MSQLLVVEKVEVVLLEQTIKALLEVQGVELVVINGINQVVLEQQMREEMVETLPLLSRLLLVHQELEVEVHQE